MRVDPIVAQWKLGETGDRRDVFRAFGDNHEIQLTTPRRPVSLVPDGLIQRRDARLSETLEGAASLRPESG